MRILFLTDNFPPETNAPASRTHEHAKRWAAAGHDVTVITCAPNFPRGRVFDGYANRVRTVETVDRIRVVRVKTFIARNSGFFLRTLDYLSFMVAGFVAALFERRPDVIVATSPQFFCAAAGWLTSVFKRRPFVFELRDIWPASIAAVGASSRTPILRALERLELFLYRRATSIVAVTHSFRDELVERGVPREKIHVVTNGVDLSRYAPLSRDTALGAELGLEGRFVVGYVGTHGMAHALMSALDAAARLDGRGNVHFLFVGDGAEREALLARSAELG
ncbi:MAG: glycosyltransferase family 4 protein, partial [Planctomycetota bacterium]